jgi:hypothetical protein
MKIKMLFALFVITSVLGATSCSSLFSSRRAKETPTLYPIIELNQGEKFGYINSKGEIVIQPQFRQAWFFSEGLALACIEHRKCGYIDETGKFVINPQFQFGSRFSEGLAGVEIEGKLGYIDKTGKFVINPQFQPSGDNEFIASIFSEGLAGVRIGGKFGYIDKTGKIIINPQFETGLPFMEDLAAVKIGEKWAFVDKEGKIIINPQFEKAHPFVNGLASVKIGNQWGYIDKTGKIEINPQFEFAAPFADEGVALVFLKDKAGYINKQGKYIVNPQYSAPRAGAPDRLDDFVLLALIITSDLSRLSFSEGRALVNVGDSSIEKSNFGYADSTGKIVINPQFKLAFPFYGDLALVVLNEGFTYAWIDKEGKIVWRVPPPKMVENTNTNANPSNTVITNPGMISNTNTTSSNTTVTTNTTAGNTNPSSQRIGRLTTDSNLRSEPNKDSMSLGIHFKGAKIRILDETSFTNDKGELSTWYKIRVTEQGCSVNANLGCGKNSPNDADEGWVNSKNVLLD